MSTGQWPTGFIDGASMFFALKTPECIQPRIAPTYCPPTDQRGEPRPIGAACDLGAFERWAELFLPLVRR